MIPFVNLSPLRIGPLVLQPFGIAVAVAILVGFTLARRRAIGSGLDVAIVERMFSWVVAGGFIGAHLFAVLAYHPDQVAADPLILLRLWEHLSSFGGIIGGLVALVLFLRFRTGALSSPKKRLYFNLVAFVFPVTLMIGRAGCAMIHDHPGSISESPFAVSLESDAAQHYAQAMYVPSDFRLFGQPIGELGFHDLGLYEFLFLALALIPLFLWLDRNRPGRIHYGVLFVGVYMPVRFLLDFLRVADATYGGLTPAQWIALLLVVVLVFVITKAEYRSKYFSTPAVE